MALPALAVLVLGGVDLAAVQSDRVKLQDIADAAALAGARELGLAVDASGPAARAQAYIDAQLAEWTHGPQTVTPAVDVITLAGGERALRATLHANRISFFGNLLPPGGWNFRAEATATSISVTPLCVLTHGAEGKESLKLRDQAQIRAPACLVHSNREIKVEGVARITAALVQAVRRASGAITPAPSSGAVAIPDPFASIDLDGRARRSALGCSPSGLPREFNSGRHYLAPGIHCNGIKVQGTAELILEPGEHWFLGGALEVKNDARLIGDDVVLMFDKKSKFEFRDRGRVRLDGRESGPYAGMVMIGTRDNDEDFVISSDNVDSLLGVIYVPSARLIVDGRSDVARESAWTVIVARSLELRGSPSLFINANYEMSDVPVPQGVGPSSGGSRLVQ